MPLDPLEISFIRQIHDQPMNRELRLVFADWLEDQGDPLCEHIRRDQQDGYRTYHITRMLQALNSTTMWPVSAFSLASPDFFDHGHWLALLADVSEREYFAMIAGWRRSNHWVLNRITHIPCHMEVNFNLPPMVHFRLSITFHECKWTAIVGSYRGLKKLPRLTAPLTPWHMERSTQRVVDVELNGDLVWDDWQYVSSVVFPV
jgi:uncharacterized protein (TIGR02996 family)